VYTRRNKIVEAPHVEQPQPMEQLSSHVDPDITNHEVNQSLETRREDVDPSINLPLAIRKEVRSKARKPPVRYGFEDDNKDVKDIANHVS
jgi:hypothetical protein